MSEDTLAVHPDGELPLGGQTIGQRRRLPGKAELLDRHVEEARQSVRAALHRAVELRKA